MEVWGRRVNFSDELVVPESHCWLMPRLVPFDGDHLISKLFSPDQTVAY